MHGFNGRAVPGSAGSVQRGQPQIDPSRTISSAARSAAPRLVVLDVVAQAREANAIADDVDVDHRGMAVDLEPTVVPDGDAGVAAHVYGRLTGRAMPPSNGGIQ